MKEFIVTILVTFAENQVVTVPLFNVELSPAMLIYVNANPTLGEEREYILKRKSWMKRHETKILSFIILAAKLEQEFSEPFNIHNECFAVQK